MRGSAIGERLPSSLSAFFVQRKLARQLAVKIGVEMNILGKFCEGGYTFFLLHTFKGVAKNSMDVRLFLFGDLNESGICRMSGDHKVDQLYDGEWSVSDESMRTLLGRSRIDHPHSSTIHRIRHSNEQFLRE